MTTFYMIRHACTDLTGKTLPGRMPGIALNAAGREQAERLCARLRHSGIAAIYSSPLERARQTAEPLARALALAVQSRERLVEIDPGEWTGGALQELDRLPLWRRYNTFRSGTRAPGGELMLDVQSRVVDELEWLREKHPGEKLALFTHADVIKAAIMHYAGMPLDFHLRLEINPASISILTLDQTGPQILLVNDCGQLG